MVDYGKQLLSKIEDRSAVVGIIGLGYVGLPLALAFTEKGFRVIGFDTDPVKIDKITSGDCYIKHLDPTRLTQAIGLVNDTSKLKTQNSKLKTDEAIGTGKPLLVATADFERLNEPDAILICVPTPLGPHKEPDLQYVEASARAIRETLRPGQLIVLESTTYPGTTEDLLRPILEDCGEPRMAAGTAAPQTAPAPLVGQASRLPNERSEINDQPANRGNRESATNDARRAEELKTQNSKLKTLKCGTHFFLAFSPEREDPGNPTYGTTNVPKIVGGVDPLSGDLAQALYDQVVDATVRTSSASIAEAAKITENVFRSVNIALVNELKVIYDRLGIDIWEVLDAAETKPFGFMRFNPGPGLGGHCIIGTEWLRVRGCGISGVYRAADLFKLMSRQHPAVATRNGIFVEPAGLEALALDSKSGEVDWFPVSTLYRGRFEGSGRQFTTCDNRRLVVTSEHPMLVVREDAVETVSARDRETRRCTSVGLGSG